jgi:hypothetical protein
VRAIIHNILGQQATKEDKVETYLGGGVTIGWDFNLQYSNFRVGPKREALLKMVYAFFVAIPTHLGPLAGGTYDKDDTTGEFVHPLASSHAIKSLRGILCPFA